MKHLRIDNTSQCRCDEDLFSRKDKAIVDALGEHGPSRLSLKMQKFVRLFELRSSRPKELQKGRSSY